VGNIRDALFKHLLARRYGGVNILRIEDTDRTRYVPGCEEEIVESLRWMGIEWQEGLGVGGPHGPYRQSERKEAGIYDKWIRVLLESGHAYKAFDTPEELAAMREDQQAKKAAIGYFGGIWRDAAPGAVEAAEREGRPYVIRQRIPRGEVIAIDDLIRGRLEWNSDEIDDPVLIKADGMPTYHFAAMVDDHLMEITHIMRGEEWISSAPKHAALFDAFGWARPIFVHCPVIKGKDGAKLSKRHGDTRCLDFRSAGFLPEALANFIALIGWSPGDDREVMTMDELAEAFSLDGLQPSPGVFDIDKLRWMNGQHIRRLGAESLCARFHRFASHPETVEYWGRPDHSQTPGVGMLATMARAVETDAAYSQAALLLGRERVETMADFPSVVGFCFVDEPEIDPAAAQKWLNEPHVEEMFVWFSDQLAAHEVGGEASAAADLRPGGSGGVSVEWCEAKVREYAARRGFEKLGPVVHPLRVALTGKTTGPGLYELMSVLGPTRLRLRLARAIRAQSRPSAS
jgi:glutamyl-tRNA synthetase